MNRKEFLRNCACGVCSCAAVGMITPVSSVAEEATPAEDWRLPFVKSRYAKLVEILSGKLSDEELSQTLQELGAYCAGTGKDFYEKYRGNIDAYVSEFKQMTGDDIDYDREKGLITITGAERNECFCPLVDKALTPKKACDCSQGWQETIYETILEKKVRAELKESILYGNKRCVFQIHISS